MTMRKFITCFSAIIVMLIFLQHHLVASLSPIKQKTALFQFKQSLNIGTPRICSYFYSYVYDYESPSHPKTKNWSMSSDHCTWEGVSCEHQTGHVIGLDLSCSQLEGAILPNSTLFQLSHLRFLNLSQNNFSLSNDFPQEFGFFAKGLTHLNLSYTYFSGRVPSGISHLYKMVSLDLSGLYNTDLEKEVFKSLFQNLTQLRVLNLKSVNISSVLPVNLSSSLRVLDLRYTGLHGVLPQEVFHLPNIELLALGGSSNDEETGLQAVLPKVKWGSSGTLQHLFIYGIDLNGGISDSIGFLESLASLELWSCNLSGRLPRSMGKLGQLIYLGLNDNNFNGPIPKLLANLTNLRYLSIYQNNFSGPLPSFVAHFKDIIRLYVDGNGLTGLLPPWLFKYPSLEELDVSDNGFTGQLYEFDSYKSQLKYFACMNNSLSGSIPQSFSQLPNLTILDLSSNNFSGVLDAKMFLGLQYLDISYNQIDGEIPHGIGNNIRYLDLRSNNLNGSLTTSICNSSSLEILILSHNNLSGVLPICRTNLTRSPLSVFDLRMNNIQGNIPSTLSNFRNLQTINLNGNRLEGTIPSSFAEFDSLKVLDLGNNQIKDTFPQCLEALPYLQVLVLKSNNFYGLINKSSKIEHPFPRLRIIDLSYNEFSGPLPAMYFQNFKAMMIGDVNNGKVTYIGQQFSASVSYSDSIILLIKGVEIEFVKILTVLATIDVSRNNFEGEILECIGDLVSLRYLNLSHNHLTGHIPSPIGNLSMLESLDLSSNQLQGEIPRQLASLYSLAYLNLSCNQLRGHIPEGLQFNTFENDSYVGNLGLCGHPLSKKCEIGTQEEDDEDDDYIFNGFTWEVVVIGYGCGVVPAFIAGYLMLLAGKPKWFAGIIARELGLKIRRMEIKWR